jgi:FLVCR family MFS transporter
LILNGLAGPVVMSAPSVISAVWFPPEQRTFATGVTAMANYYGLALSFILGPLMVSNYGRFNRTSNYSSTNHCVHVIDNLDTLREDIRWYQYVEFIAASVSFLAILCYFPSVNKLRR